MQINFLVTFIEMNACLVKDIFGFLLAIIHLISILLNKRKNGKSLW